MTRLYEVVRSVSKRSPAALNALIRRYFPAANYDLWMAEQSDPYRNEEAEFRCASSPCTLGIFREPRHYHANFVAACRQMSISYKLLDLMGPDWVRTVREANCDAYLVWPPSSRRVWKELYDERLKVMVDDWGMTIFPTYDELWLWESKRRMRDWTAAHGLPMPATHIFYNRDEALEFAEKVELPIISKTDHGDCSRGVRILRTRRDAVNLVRRAFGRGISFRERSSGEKEAGFILFQEFIPDATEWRMIRVDESYFGHMKKKIGDFHSGSHTALEGEPPRELLDLTRHITDIKGFKSMALDILLSRDGRPHVTELQTIWGYTGDAKGQCPDGQLYAGRYKYNADQDNWVYEPGIFDENICCNLRVKYLVDRLVQQSAVTNVTL
jgi:hypothetical protein